MNQEFLKIIMRIGMALSVLLGSCLTTHAADYYWVGGTGNWSDFANHWADASGGAVFHTSVPSAADRVIFDANSFTAASQIVTVDVNTFCSDFLIDNVTFNPQIRSTGPAITVDQDFLTLGGPAIFYCQGSFIVNGNWIATSSMTFTTFNTTVIGDIRLGTSTGSWTVNSSLQLHGSIHTSPNMTFTANNAINFLSATTDSIDLNDHALNASVVFDNATGSWVLLSDVTTSNGRNLTMTSGSLITNGYTMDIGGSFTANAATVKTLDFTDSDTLKVGFFWNIGKTNTTLNMDSCTLLMNISYSSDYNFYGGDHTYHNIIVNYTNTNSHSARDFNFNHSNQYGDIFFRTLGTRALYVYFNADSDPTGNVSYGNINLEMNVAGSFVRFNAQPRASSTHGNIDVNMVNGGSVYNQYVMHADDVQVNFGGTSTSTFQLAGFNTLDTFGNVFVNNSGSLPVNILCYSAATIDSLKLNAGTVLNLYYSNTTLTIMEALILQGDCTGQVEVKNNFEGTQSHFVIDPAADVQVDYVILSNNNITPSGTYSATNAVNAGNISGWNLTSVTPTDLYWVGGTGAWNDPSHWSPSSGGTADSCRPGTYTNVIFDENSFSAGGQTVTLSGTVIFRDMLWTNTVVGNPTVNGSALFIAYGDMVLDATFNWSAYATMEIRGSIIIAPEVNWTFAGRMNFRSDSTNNIIDMGGNDIKDEITFDCITHQTLPKWTLQDDFILNSLSTSDEITFSCGEFVTNGFDVDAAYAFYLTPSTAQDSISLNFVGSDTIRMYRYWRHQYTRGVHMQGGNSIILIENNSSSQDILFDGGPGVTYGNVLLRNTYDGPESQPINVQGSSSIDHLICQSTGSSGNSVVNLENLANESNDYSMVSMTLAGLVNTVNFSQLANGANYGDVNLLFTNTNNPTNTVWFNTPSYEASSFGNVFVDLATTGEINHRRSSLYQNVLISAANSYDIDLYNTDSIGTYKTQINSVTNDGTAIIHVNGPIIDSFIVAPATTIEFLGNATIMEHLNVLGTCDKILKITSNSPGLSRTINMSNGATTSADFISLKDNTISGSGTYNATNAVDLGNVVGWTLSIAVPLDYYWVGGSGNWNESSHWALTSGGAPDVCIPSFKDNVFFDQNSFSASGQTVSISNSVAAVNDMTWLAGLIGIPELNGNQKLIVNGDLTVSDTMAWEQSGTLESGGSISILPEVLWNDDGETHFISDDTSFIDFGGHVLKSAVLFESKSGSSTPKWTLLNDLIVDELLTTTDGIDFNDGVFISNGYEIDAGYDWIFAGSSNRVADFTGTDTIRMRHRWLLSTPANVSLAMGAATIMIVQEVGGASYQIINFDGGQKNYHNIIIQNDFFPYGNTVQNIDSVHQFLFKSSYYRAFLNFYSGAMTFNTLSFDLSGNSTSPSNRPIMNLSQSAPNTIHRLNMINSGTANAMLQMTRNNTIDSLVLNGPVDFYMSNTGLVQTIGYIELNSSCTDRITIRGLTSGTPSILNMTSPADINAEWLNLQYHTIQGSGTYNAEKSTTTGTVTGWNIMEAAFTLYWIGGNGNWTDPTNWSLTSGGPPNNCLIPTASDNVIFDANSFTGTGQRVTIDQALSCKNMIWNGALFNPEFYSFNTVEIFGTLIIKDEIKWTAYYALTIHGSMEMNSDMTQTFTPGSPVYFKSTLPGNTIRMGGYEFNRNVEFDGIGGEWTLLDDFIIEELSSPDSKGITYKAGKLISNGFNIDASSYFKYSGNSQKEFDFTGSDSVKMSGEWSMATTNTVLNMDDCTLIIDRETSGTIYLRGGNHTYHDVEIRNSYLYNSTIYIYHNNAFRDFRMTTNLRKNLLFFDSNSFRNFNTNYDYDDVVNPPSITFNSTNSFTSFSIISIGDQGPSPVKFLDDNTFGSFVATGKGTRIEFGAGMTQTVDNLAILGTGSAPVLLNSTLTDSSATIEKLSGEVCLDFINLKDINATGGATFNAGASSVDLGNNTNWSFNSCSGFYWVGGSGNWSDLSHWASSSGGVANKLVLPLFADDVYFDFNSFTTPGQVVTLDTIPTTLDMNWLSSAYSPTLNPGSISDINIYGSLYFTSAMTNNYTGNYNFKGSSDTFFIDGAGQNLSVINIEGPAPANPTAFWNLVNDLNADSVNITQGGINLNSFDLTASYVNINSSDTKIIQLGSGDITINNGAWRVQDTTGLSFDAATSGIHMEDTSALFEGGGLTYNNVHFNSNPMQTASLKGSNTFNILEFSPGLDMTLEDHSTQTMLTELLTAGTCQNEIFIQSETVDSTANFIQSSGTVNAIFNTIKDNAASGGATFNAANCIDAGGNSGWNFSAPPPYSVSIIGTDATCPELNNGSATANVSGGIAPFSYAWSNFDNTQTTNFLVAGIYSVSVTDSTGCVAVDTVTISQPSTYNFSVSGLPGDTICYTGTDATIEITVTGAALPLTYLWNDGGTTEDRTGLTRGTYSVVVTDSNNCEIMESVDIITYDSLDATFAASSAVICSDAIYTFTSSGNNTGLPWTYDWDFGTATATDSIAQHTFLSTGAHAVNLTVTDFRNCEGSHSELYDVLPGIQVTADVTGTSCPTACDGSIALNVSGGTGPIEVSLQEFNHGFDGTVIDNAVFEYDNFVNYSQNNELSAASSDFSTYFRTLETFERAVDKEFTFRFFIGYDADTWIGWYTNGPMSNYYVDIVYAMRIGASNTSPYLYIYEDGSFEQSVGHLVTSFAYNAWYDCRIVLKAVGAEYYIRKDGNSLWDHVYSSSYSSEDDLRLGMNHQDNTMQTDDWIVRTVNPDTSGLCVGDYNFSISDSVGCEISLTRSVSSTDTIPPSITCPADVSVSNDAGACSATSVNLGSPVTSDNCGIDSLFNDAPDTFLLGTTRVTWTVTDSSGNQDTCSHVVIVSDTTAPNMTCKNIIVQLDSNNMASIAPGDLDDGSSDNCGNMVLSFGSGQISFDCDDADQMFNVTLIGVDDAGNTDSCTAQVTIADDNYPCNQAPVAACQDITVFANGSCQGTAAAPDFDNGSSDPDLDSLIFSVVPAGPYSIGTTDVVVTVSDTFGEMDTCHASVTVQDTTSPSPICKNIIVYLDSNGNASIDSNALENGSSDNCSIDSLSVSPQAFTCVDTGSNIVTMTVTDVNGNSAICNATVTVLDTLNPTPVCKNITVFLDENGSVSLDSNAVEDGSNDNCGIASVSVSPNSFICADTGAQLVTMTVTDVNGNSAVCGATITVVDTLKPTPLCKNITVYLDENGTVSLDSNAVENGSSDNCGIASVSVSPNSFICADTGAQSVTMTVTDVNGNSANCSATVTVLDTLNPTPVCKNITVFLDENGSVSLDSNAVEDGSSDNCTIASVSVSPNSFICADTGTQSVTMTVTDVNGNSANCNATVTVLDTLSPIAVCKNITVFLDENGAVSLDSNAVDDGSSDNCGIASVSVSPNSFNCLDTGANLVTMTVTDVNGNSSICSATVTVEDNEDPVPDVVNLPDATGECSVTVMAPTATDNCAGAVTGTTTDPTTYTTQGTFNVSWTYDDGNGNTSSQNQTVIVDDVTPPVANCQDITVVLDSMGNASITAADIIPPGTFNGFFDSGQSIGPAISRYGSAIGDIDGDGDLDAVTANWNDAPNRVFFNDGTGNFTDSGQLLGSSTTRSLTLGDVDGDGDLDVFCSNNNQPNKVYLNDGSGNFTDSGQNLGTSYSWHTSFGDVDGDGDLDAFVANTLNQPNLVWINNGNGVFTDSGQSLGSQYSASVELGDLDGDGDLDAFVNNGNTTNNANRVYFNDGTGTFTDSGQALGLNHSGGLDLGDVDGDGDLDAIAANSSTNAILWLNDGTGSFTDSGQSLGAGYTYPVFADFDSDGDLDIHFGKNGPPNPVYLNDGAGNYSYSGFSIGTSKARRASVGDLDGDGDLDIFEPNNGEVSRVYFNNSVLSVFDNCGIVSDTIDISNFGCSDVGTDTVTLTVIDVGGNVTQCTSTVTVLDTINPTAVCKNITVFLDENGSVSLDSNAVEDGSSDNCTIASVSVSPNSFICADTGAQSVTMTVTDVNDNSANCSATVTVLDTINPIAVCKNITVFLDENGSVSLDSNAVNNGSSDNCTIASVSVGPNSFICADTGAQSVTMTVTDVNGNSANCNATVTVLDTLNPIAVCKNITVYLDENGSVSLDSNAVEDGSSDNCGITSVSVSPNSFICVDTGANLVTMTVTDVNGNSSICAATVTVFDTLKPTAICKNITLYLDENGSVSLDSNAVEDGSTDNCGIASVSVSPNSFICADTGAQSVTMTVTDVNGNSANCNATVTVVDSTSPTLVCPDLGGGSSEELDQSNILVDGDAFVGIGLGLGQSFTAGSSGLLTKITVKVSVEIFPGNFVASIEGDSAVLYIQSPGEYTFVFTSPITVIAGEVYEFFINVPTAGPFTGFAEIGSDVYAGGNMIWINAGSPMDLPSNDMYFKTFVDPVTVFYTDSGLCTAELSLFASAADSCGIDTVTYNIGGQGISFPHMFNVGTTTVDVLAIDEHGNSSACSYSVTVQDTTSPNAICQDINVYLDENGSVSLDSNAVDNGSTDNCTITSITVSPNSFNCVDTGANSVTMTVTDVNGNSSMCSATVTVLDTLNPTPLCKNITVYLDENGSVSLDSNAVENGSSDNCLIASVSVSPNSFICVDTGTNLVTMTVTDVNGNSANCSATVTVLDTLNPIAVCKNITVFLDENGAVSLDSNAVDNGSTDNCTTTSVSVSPNSFICADTGANLVTMTVTDVNGNSSICAATVTVIDTLKPTAICKNITVYLDENGSVSLDSNALEDGSSDNCTIASVSVSPNLFTCADAGPQIATMTVTDINGNLSTCIATVTVVDTTSPTLVCPDLNGVSTEGLDQSNTIHEGPMTVLYTVGAGQSFTTGSSGLLTKITVKVLELFVAGNIEAGIGGETSVISVTDTGDYTFVFASPITVMAGQVYDFSIHGLGGTWISLAYNSSDVYAGGHLIVFTGGIPTNVPSSDLYFETFVLEPATVFYTDPGLCTAELSLFATATDSCGIDTITYNVEGQGISFPHLFNVGTTTVDVLAIDEHGNSSACSYSVTVQDTTSPNATCQNINVYLDENGSVSLDSNAVNNGSTDNCIITSVSVSPNSFNCVDTGANSVTMTVTDVNGNSSICSATVTVLDTLNPTPLCKNITVYLDENGSVALDSNAVENGSSDNCTIASVSVSPNSFICADTGANLVTMTVTDANGNSANCSATVTVLDTLNPTPVCKNITVFLDENGSVSLDSNAVEDGSSDNCGIASVSLSPNSFICDDAGPNAVTMTVTDVNNNSSICSATVTVVDTLKPTASNPNDIMIQCFSDVPAPDPSVVDDEMDNCLAANLTVAFVSDDITSVTCNGDTVTITRTYSVTDQANNSILVVQMIHVKDTIAPTGTPPDSAFYMCVAEVPAADPSVITDETDNCDPAPVVTVVDTDNGGQGCAGDPLIITRTFTITDCAGRARDTVQTIVVMDEVAPVFTGNLPADTIMKTTTNTDCQLYIDGYDLKLPTVSDSCDSNPQVTITSDNVSVSFSGVGPWSATFPVGTTLVTQTVTDDCGNSSDYEFVVIINDMTIPTAYNCPPSAIDLDAVSVDPGQCQGTHSWLNPGFFDNCVVIKLELIFTSDSNNVPAGPLPADKTYYGAGAFGGQFETIIFPVGTTIVSFVATDNNGMVNEACFMKVEVIDDESPNPVCQDLTLYLDENGLASIDSNALDNGSSDNCAMGSISLSQMNFDCDDLSGPVVVTMTVTDTTGNADSCIANVTVLDTIRPVALCQNITVMLDSNGNASIIPSMLDSGSSDNCTASGNLTLSIDKSTFNCTDIATGGEAVNPITDLFFSEYIEGSGNNKCLEIYNGTDAPIDLSGYSIEKYVNGATSGMIINLSGTLMIGDVYVVCNGSAAAGFLAQADATSGSVSHNGDDAYALFKGTTAIDIFGKIGEDPGTSWDAGPISTANQTLVRKATVYTGNIEDAAGFPALGTEWISFAQNMATELGSHTVTLPPPPTGDGVIVTLTVEDESGNIDMCTAEVLVLDTIAPIAICQNLTVYLDENGSVVLDSNALDNGSSDNCGIASLSVNPNSFTCVDTGSNSVTLTVLDVNGNSSSCLATVTVLDTINPTPSCQNIIVYLDENGSVSLDSNAVENGSMDNCGIASVSLSPNAFMCVDTGANMATMTVTDVNGNSSICNAMVTVLDTLNPTPLCKNITVYLDENGSVSLDSNAVENGSSDNCTISSVSVSPNAFMCADTGANLVTMTVTDVSGNLSTCIATVTVIDTLNPTAVCKNITVYLDENGTVSLDSNAVDNGSSGNCTIASISISPNSFICADTGANLVTMTVTDVNGNSSICNATVTVVDTLNPTPSCKNITVYLDENGSVSLDSSAVENGSSDNCSIASVSVSPNAFMCVDTGANLVTMTVTDVNGNLSTCMATVTVLDTLNPTPLCKNITVFLDENGSVSLDSNAVENGSTDNCGIASVSLSPNSFICDDAGPNAVTMTVTDVNGNSSICVATVTVVDTLKPTASNPDDIMVQCFSDVPGPDPSVVDDEMDNCLAANLTVAFVSDDITTATCNSDSVTIIRTYSVEDQAGNSILVVQMIHVKDTIGPIGTPPDSAFYTCVTDVPAADPSVITDETDNCDPSPVVTVLDTDNGGQGCSGDPLVIARTYTLTDCAGQSTDIVQIIVVADDSIPVFTGNLPADTIRKPTTTTDCQLYLDAFDLILPTVFDHEDPNPVVTISSDNVSVSFSGPGPWSATFPVGITTVTLTVTDDCGNFSTYDFVVIIEDLTVPAMTNCPSWAVGMDAIPADSGTTQGTHNWINPGFNDNCGVQMFEIRFTADSVDTPSGPLPADKTYYGAGAFGGQNESIVFPVGTTIVTFIATDVNGGSNANCIMKVEVVDDEDPNAVCQDIMAYLDENGMVTIDSNALDNGSYDNNGIASFTLSQTDFDCNDLFAPVPVSMIVNDLYGNADTCIANVSVLDTIRPEITDCPSDILFVSDSGSCGTAITWSSLTTSDNCPGEILTQTAGPSSGSFFPVGVTVIEYTVTDASNLTDTCSFTITVVDSIPPTVVLQDVTITLDSNDIAVLDASTMDLSSSDNCAIDTIYANRDTFTCADRKVTEVIVTIRDIYGNTSTGTAHVTLNGLISQSTVYVDLNATGGNQTGLSWEDAFLNIDHVLAACIADIDTIFVAQGEYIPSINSRTSGYYFTDSMVVLGGYTNQGAERDTTGTTTIMCGDIGVSADSTDNVYHTLLIDSYATNVVVDGFTISCGYADGTNPLEDQGAGVLCLGTATMSHIIITDNFSTDQGAAVLVTGTGDLSLSHSTIKSDNQSSTNVLFGNDVGSILLLDAETIIVE